MLNRGKMQSTSFSSSSPSCCCAVTPTPTPNSSNSHSYGYFQWPHSTYHGVRRRKVSVAVAATTITKARVSLSHPNSDVRFRARVVNCFSEKAAESDIKVESSPPPSFNSLSSSTGLDVECLVSSSSQTEGLSKSSTTEIKDGGDYYQNVQQGSFSFEMLLGVLWEWGLLVSPFFFWGTAMVAMKEVLPKTGPFFVSSFRLIPAGFLLVAFAASRGRPFPSGIAAWLSISLFALVDATCFQVIIDSQPLTVAILAALLFGESIGFVGASGLGLGVIGLLLLEVPSLAFDESNFSLWGSGEWWMLLAAQSMAIGTVMVRWVCKYSDPVMATGWHMVIGGLPLVAISILNHDPALNGSLYELTASDLLALLYSSVFGSAISYGVFFFNATRGSLTKLSSLTFLTPMFASFFGFLYLGETFSPLQLTGAFVTVVAIYMVNYKNGSE